MATSIWQAVTQQLRLVSSVPAKRQRKINQWGIASERLEERALLSATGMEAVTAEVAQESRAAVMYPNVAGNWTFTIDNEVDVDAVLTQKKNKVTAQFDFPPLGEITLKGKLSKNSPLELNGKAKINAPQLGKVKIELTGVFDESGENFQAIARLISRAIPNPGSIDIDGTRAVGTALTTSGARAATFPAVDGVWDFELSSSLLGTQTGELQINQSEGSRKFTGEFDAGIADMVFKGKMNSSDPTQAKGKATLIPISGKKIKAKFTIEFSNQHTELEGTATTKKFPTVTFSGIRNNVG